jgi:hypothetical protein
MMPNRRARKTGRLVLYRDVAGEGARAYRRIRLSIANADQPRPAHRGRDSGLTGARPVRAAHEASSPHDPRAESRSMKVSNAPRSPMHPSSTPIRWTGLLFRLARPNHSSRARARRRPGPTTGAVDHPGPARGFTTDQCDRLGALGPRAFDHGGPARALRRRTAQGREPGRECRRRRRTAVAPLAGPTGVRPPGTTRKLRLGPLASWSRPVGPAWRTATGSR